MRTRPALTTLLAAVALLVVAGCGSEPSAAGPTAAVGTSSSAASPSSPSSPATPASRPAPLPSCQKVWTTERPRLPDTYQGCRQGTERVTAHIRCESGQLLYHFRDHYYAVLGGPVIHTDTPLGQDPRYRRTHRSCTG